MPKAENGILKKPSGVRNCLKFIFLDSLNEAFENPGTKTFSSPVPIPWEEAASNLKKMETKFFPK